MDRVRSARAARYQIVARLAHEPPHAWVGGSEVAHQHALVVLGSPLQHRGDERDTETGAPVAAKVHDARSLVVLVSGQIRVGELAHWNEHEGVSEALKGACQREMEIVSLSCHSAVVEK